MKKSKKLFITIALVVLVIITGIGYSIYWAFYDIQRLKGQEFLAESSSPNGTYTVTAYLNNGGATTGNAVLATLKDNLKGSTKNIYWQYKCEDADMTWYGDETIIINGVELNVKKDVYDYRTVDVYNFRRE